MANMFEVGLSLDCVPHKRVNLLYEGHNPEYFPTELEVNPVKPLPPGKCLYLSEDVREGYDPPNPPDEQEMPTYGNLLEEAPDNPGDVEMQGINTIIEQEKMQ